MASNPPLFQVEDNSGEDFFDKLVNDDDDVDFKITASSPSNAPVFTDENESNEALQVFANLNINELNSNGEPNGKLQPKLVCDNSLEGVGDLSSEVEKVGRVSEAGHVEETGNRLVASGSFEFDNVVEKSENESGDTERSSDATVVSKSSDDALSDQTVVTKNEGFLGAPGIKQVDWSAFHADPDQNDNSGFGSYSDFFGEFESGSTGNAIENPTRSFIDNGPQPNVGNSLNESTFIENTNNNFQLGDTYNSTAAADLSTSTDDVNTTDYWENQYPGWKYDPNTGQWYQIDGYDKSSSMQADSSDHTSAWDGQTELSYLQQSAQSVAASVAEVGSTVSLSSWNQSSLVSNDSDTTNQNQVSHVSSQNNEVSSEWNQGSLDNYPSHMVFDPQYPGWYYDTVANEWRALESYIASVQSTSQVHGQVNHDGYGSTHASSQSQHGNQEAYTTHDLGDNYGSQGFGSQVQDHKWVGSVSIRNEQSPSLWQPGTAANNEANSFYSGNQLIDNQSGQNIYMDAHGNQQNTVQPGVTGSYYSNTSQSPNISAASRSQSFSTDGNLSHRFNDPAINKSGQKHFYDDYYSSKNSNNRCQQPIQSAQISYSPVAGRSSAGRPKHALVTFGFGGKLIVIKDTNSGSFGAQNLAGGTISVLSLADVANNNIDASKHGIGACNYIHALSRQHAPGPLTGGNVGIKELNKWIDERISNLRSHDMDYSKAEVLKLLLSLLKIACQYDGKLRNPYGTDASLKETDTPEAAVARLFASAKGNGQQFDQYGAVTQCLQQMPSEGQMRATAAEVQTLLVSGRKKEALQCAQEGQLWGPALVLAAQLGDQFYVETVKQMGLRQLRAGSPLRTLCLLIAGQPADVFLGDIPGHSNIAVPVNIPQQSAQVGASNMLDDWEENLAVIAANRTKDDELVLIHLGDCLWKERSDIIAAHICYLVAEASFEPFSDSARLCLVGADHLKHPRTYASPEASQVVMKFSYSSEVLSHLFNLPILCPQETTAIPMRTEIYEYSKTLGNSQFILLPFQPYKLIYAHMLAEVGRTTEALKYCQAVLKSLKTGRNPEAENLRQLASSLEERIKAHQQGGFSTNLAPKEFIGKLLNLFDSTAHRVVGGLPPPVPNSGAAMHGNENHRQSMGPRVSTSQSTLAMSSLVPSQSMEPINEWAADGNKMSMHTRSVSEPDFGRSPRQADSKNAGSSGMQGKTSATGTSRFGFGFGSSLLQKTVGLVLKPRSERQAKLGDSNKFYYDEKLKRWVEEGAEPPAEETALPPPPTTAAFQNGDHRLNGLQNEAFTSNGIPDLKSLDNNSGMPPLPPTSNQYSARGRLGVRSRYVDTFNQGSGKATNSFQSPPVPSSKPATTGSNPKFLVPAPVSSIMEQQPVVDDTTQSTHFPTDNTSTSPLDTSSFHTSTPPNAISMQRFASLNDIGNDMMSESSSFMAHSRRTASWSGSFNGSFSPVQKGEVKPLGEVLGMHPSSFMQDDGSSTRNDGSFGDDLHEVEL